MTDVEHLKLLKVIFTNILNHPNEHKYRDLNLQRISKKLKNSSTYLEWLYNAGFQVSDNNKRLILHPSKLHQLQEIHDSLTLIIDESNRNYPTQSMAESKQNRLTNTVNAYQQSRSVHTQCILNDCLPLKIIGNILKSYNKYIERHQSNELQKCNVYDVIGNKYDNVKLLNAFNHLLNHHANEFENIYHRLQSAVYNNESTCNISKCLLMRRNRRNRSKISKNDNILRQLYFSDDEIVEQQLIDRIHCHFMHTFDIGYKLTTKQRQTTENEVDTKLESKDDDNEHSTKLVTNIDTNIDVKISNTKFKSDSKPYSLGIRFFYWDIYKNNNNTWDPYLWVTNFDHANSNYTLGECYVANKYSSFKQELLDNVICCISNCQWLQLVKKANDYIQTDLVRNIQCRDNDACYLYGINEQRMTRDHLIAIMVQCNFDILQREFTKTFRKQTPTETHDSLKQRHSNYYFLAKLLRECVEYFGIENKKPMSLYHGVNQHFTFESLKAFIKGPFSTTTSQSVAVNFCENQGMILEMKVAAPDFSRAGGGGFVCQYFSDFPNEQEIFFIGGSTEFIIKDIVEAPLGKSYKRYISGLEVITEDMTTGGIRESTTVYSVLGNLMLLALTRKQLQELTNIPSYMWCVGDRLKRESSSKQMAFRLLADEVYRNKPNHPHAHRFKSCPDYFRKLFHSHCLNVKLVHLDLENNKLLKLYFYNDKTNWVDFNMVNVIFPNYIRMICSNPSSMIVALESILSFIQSTENAKLQEIYVPMDMTEDIEKYVFDYVHMFASLSWKINVRISNKSNNMLNLYHNAYQSTILEFYQMFAESDQSMEEFLKKVQGFGRMFLTHHKCLIITKENVMHSIYDYYDEHGAEKIRNSLYQRK